jgi:hypothetical protein
MAVIMAYVPEPESGAKVLNWMTPPRNGSVDIALAPTSENEKRQPFWKLLVFRIDAFRGC